jgi:hypothetical protein
VIPGDDSFFGIFVLFDGVQFHQVGIILNGIFSHSDEGSGRWEPVGFERDEVGDSSDEWGHQVNHFNLHVFSEDTAKHGDNQENTAGDVSLSFQFDCIQQDEQRCPTPQRNLFQVHSDNDQ